MPPSGPTARELELRAWLVAAIAERLRRPPESIDPDEPFHRFGIDSLERVNIAFELESWLGYPIDEATLAEVSTINSLARHLADAELQQRQPRTA